MSVVQSLPLITLSIDQLSSSQIIKLHITVKYNPFNHLHFLKTLLHCAVYDGYLNIIKVLMEFGSNPNIKEKVNNLGGNFVITPLILNY